MTVRAKIGEAEPVPILEAGCGEIDLVNENGIALMETIAEQLGMVNATPAELLAVLLAIAGPDLLKMSDFDLESWMNEDMPVFTAALELLNEGN